MIVIKFPFFLGHVVDSFNRLPDKVTFLQIFEDVGLRLIHDVAKFLNSIHSLWVPVIKLSINLWEAHKFMTWLVKLWVALVLVEVDLYPKLMIAAFELKELIFVCHFIDAPVPQLLLGLHAEISRPKDQRIHL